MQATTLKLTDSDSEIKKQLHTTLANEFMNLRSALVTQGVNFHQTILYKSRTVSLRVKFSLDPCLPAPLRIYHISSFLRNHGVNDNH